MLYGHAIIFFFRNEHPFRDFERVKHIGPIFPIKISTILIDEDMEIDEGPYSDGLTLSITELFRLDSILGYIAYISERQPILFGSSLEQEHSLVFEFPDQEMLHSVELSHPDLFGSGIGNGYSIWRNIHILDRHRHPSMFDRISEEPSFS